MKRLLGHIGRRLGGERGVAVPIFAVGIVAIMGLTALAVDLGWLYLQRDRTQAAADAAALAGVTALPAFPDVAESEARRVAASNGYEHGVAGALVETRPLAAQKLEATVTKPVETFFLKVLGWDTVTISRQAVAEYATQLPMGSPENYLGGPDGGAKPLYVAVNGPTTNYQGGDPQSTTCAPRTFTPPDVWGPDCDGSPNPDYDPDGYYYAVDVAAGATSLKVELYDPWGYDRGFDGTYPQPYDLGARDFETHFTLYDVDDTPFNAQDNTVVLCSGTYGSGPGTDHDPAQWTQLCNIPISLPGLYPLQVEAEGVEAGVNLFAMRAFTPGSASTPRMFGLGELSVAAYQLDDVNPEFYLAEVAEFHGGRTLEIELFDAGDSEDSVFIQIIRPDGLPAPTCAWTTRTQGLSGTEDNADGNGCTIDAHGGGQPGSSGNVGRFNEDWLDIQLPIPNGYTCAPGPAGCWWKIKVIASEPRDRTTWHAKVTGVPIHLVFEPASASP